MVDTYPITCGNCLRGVAASIISSAPVQWNNQPRHVVWLQCPSCQDGSVMTASKAVYPAAPAGRSVQHLPGDVEAAWREARTAHAVAAYTASEMMCRKILMHLAVDAAGSSPGRTFVQYIDDLEAKGFVMTNLKPVIELVKDRGNAANHELPASTEDDSLRTLSIVEHLLAGIYELPGLAPPVDDE